MKTITIRKPDGTTTEIEGELVSVSEARQGHPYLDEVGDFHDGSDDVWRKHCNALQELRRFQAMGELPVEGRTQWFPMTQIIGCSTSSDEKTITLTAFFPTREAAEKALKDFGGWEHLRQVRREFHMVGGSGE